MTQHDEAPAMALIRDLTGALEQATERDHARLVRAAAEGRGWTVRAGAGAGAWTLADGAGHAVAVEFDEHGRVAEMRAEVGG